MVTNSAPDKFAGADTTALRGLELVARWAARHGLTRTDKRGQTSARWGDDARTYVWCYPGGRLWGLQLWVKPLAEPQATEVRAALQAVGAAQPQDPYWTWDRVVDEWDFIEPVLDEYLTAYRATDSRDDVRG